MNKAFGLALTGVHLIALLENPALIGALNSSGLAFVVAGVDRIDSSLPADLTLEATVAATVLAQRAPRLGWLPAAAVHRDHPYNLARRIASLDHLSGGRAGLVLGERNGYAPGGDVWGGAGLSDGLPFGAETTRDAAIVMQELWQSWPIESIVADRPSGIYAHGDQIRHIDHRGVFAIDGPLTVPTTRQGTPVLAWRARSVAEVRAADGVADLLFCPADLAVPPVGTPLYREVTATEQIPALLDDAQVAGIVLRPDDTGTGLAELLDYVGAGGAAGGPQTLRGRLALPATPIRLGATRPAFPPARSELAR